MPALFVSVVAGLSGFSLAAMFGLVGQAWMDGRTLILAFGLGPVVLGGMIVAHLVSLGIRRWLKRRRLARMVYAVTDHRAIIARVVAPSGEIEAFSLHPGDVVDTRRFENPDGSGDLYFLGQGNDHWLPARFPRGPAGRPGRDAGPRDADRRRGRLVEARGLRRLLSDATIVESTG